MAAEESAAARGCFISFRESISKHWIGVNKNVEKNGNRLIFAASPSLALKR